MESVRVRGCVVETLWTPRASRRQADASRRRNGPRKARPRSRPGPPITVRLRCKSCPDPTVRCGVGGRRPVVAEKLRKPQQATVGTKTRSAGRTPPMPPRRASSKRMRAKRITGGSHGSCGHGSALRALRAVSQSRQGEALSAREARPPHHAGPGRGREGTQPATARPSREGGAHRLLQGPGDPRRGRGRGQDGGARPRPRQDGGPDAARRRPPSRAPRPAHPGVRRARRSPMPAPDPAAGRRGRRPSTARSGRSP